MKAILSKEQFVKHIEGIRDQNDGELLLYSEFGIDTIELKKIGYASNHFTELLSQVMGDNEEWVGWWCYETDFGRNHDMTKVYDATQSLEGKSEKVIADLRTAEDLYDFLVKNMEENDGRDDTE